MAERLNPKQDDRTRSAIKTSQLVNRLQGFALNEACPQSGKPIELDKNRITAIIALLKKTLPDLTSTSHTGENGEGPVKTSLTISFVAPGK